MFLNYSRALMILSPLLGAASLYFFMTGESVLLEFSFLSINSVSFVLPLFFDLMSVSLFFVVLLISANVLKLAHMYMEEEVYMKRLVLMVCCLIVSMSLLIFIPNIVAIFIGWDGLGLTSFLLVTFYSSPKALSAGMLTAFNNRIGDVMLMLSVVFSVEFFSGFTWVSLYDNLMFCVCLVIACMTKSAQFPFCSWLPAAMEAPTPVSALVHSSTLVTAGVYMMIRLHSVVGSFCFLSTVMMSVGSVTSLLASCCAMYENDVKKIVALSTLSQLGLMMVSVSLGFPKLSLFHMLSHALLKALLFVCTGNIIHFSGHCQDIRQVNSAVKGFPLNSAAMIVSFASLSALPFMSGYYSKDAILESLLLSNVSIPVLLVMVSATMMTSLYSFRVVTYLMSGYQKSLPVVCFSEPLCSPMVCLSLGATVFGSFFVSICFPAYIECYNPLVKALMIFSLFFTFFTQFFEVKSSSYKPKQEISSMFHLTSVSTQKPLMFLMKFCKKTSKIDQSWFEFGQFPTSFRSKLKSSISEMTASMVLSLIVTAFCLIVYYM